MSAPRLEDSNDYKQHSLPRPSEDLTFSSPAHSEKQMMNGAVTYESPLRSVPALPNNYTMLRCACNHCQVHQDNPRTEEYGGYKARNGYVKCTAENSRHSLQGITFNPVTNQYVKNYQYVRSPSLPNNRNQGNVRSPSLPNNRNHGNACPQHANKLDS